MQGNSQEPRGDRTKIVKKKVRVRNKRRSVPPKGGEKNPRNDEYLITKLS